MSTTKGPSPLRRRRLSRGLIAAGSERRPSREGNNNVVGDSLASLPPQQDDDIATNTTSSSIGDVDNSIPPPSSDNVGESSNSNNSTTDNSTSNNNNSATTANKTDNSISSSTNTLPTIPKLPPKSNYTNQLVLSTINNSLKQGIITKYYLSNDKCRKSLLQNAKNTLNSKNSISKKVRGNAIGFSKEEELFINEQLRDNLDSSEYSSADEDEYDNITITNIGGGINTNSSGGVKHMQQLKLAREQRIREPYYIPTPMEYSSIGLQGLPTNPSSLGNNTNLPFNYRKLQYFDIITASDKSTARSYLKGEINELMKLRNGVLFDYLKLMQDGERGVDGVGVSSMGDNKVDINQLENECIKSEQEILSIPLSQRFSQSQLQSQQLQGDTNNNKKLTPSLSAALLIESLSINKLESLEGLSKCYDGIVSAGLALLDLNNSNADTSGENNNSTQGPGEGRKGNKKQLSTSEIMGALSPLLISTLSQSSGDVLISLSKLRAYASTPRYQRRFVQRISPYLIRPSISSIWCIQHLNDVEAIIAAVEMILDYANEVFSVGWYERGRNMLKMDSQRNVAINQLSRLNNTSSEDGSGLGLVGLLSTPGHHHHGLSLRRNKSGGSSKDQGGVISNDNMEEWEVIAIDTGIRQSIKDVFSRDWGRISTLNITSKESEAPSLRSSRRSHHGISTVKSKEWATDTSSSTGSGGAGGSSSSASSQPATIAKSPRGPMNSKLPLSPRNKAETVPGAQLPSADALESTFGPSFSSQTEIDDNTTATNSVETSSSTSVEYPTAPSSPRRDNSKQQQSTPKTPPSAHYQEASTRSSSDNNNDRISLPNFLSDHHHPPSSPSRSAPLSPSSSVGGTSISSMGTARSTNNMSSSSTTREQYRALTSTSTDRKRTVAACRALRAQITQFEDAFFQMHGRAPKGAAERAPLASTYMQYREWKRAIRADAACRIQALCRGAHVRLLLSRSDDPAVTRFVMKRRGSMHPSSSSSTNKPLNHLRIPLDMGGGADETATAASGGAAADSLRLETRTGQRGGEDDSVEVFPVPNWRNRQGRGSSGSSQQQQSSSGSSPTNAPQHSPLRSSSSRRSSSSSLPDVSVMSLAELQQRKRELKQQLKLYDMNFHKQHGRMPEKREKEPIRHLYESYNAYKNQISTIEKGEAQPGPGTAAFRGVTDAAAASPTPDNASPTNVTSPSQQHSGGGGDTSPNQGSHYRRSSSGGGTFNTDSIDMNASATTQDDTNTNATSSSSAEVASQDLASLKAEKATLHQMLRSYEKDFFKQHKRQVSSFADIRPVAGQYRRYKEIKKAIAQKSSS